MENNELKTKIGIRIKELRTELGLTQEEFAKKIGVSGKTIIANYESGYSTPNDTVRMKICSSCNCSMDYLTCQTNIRNTAYEAYSEAMHRQQIKDAGKAELVIGLSTENKSILTDEDKEEITKFAEYIANRRRESK